MVKNKNVKIEDLRQKRVVRKSTKGEELKDRGHVINIRGRNGGVTECRVRFDDGHAETVKPDEINTVT